MANAANSGEMSQRDTRTDKSVDELLHQAEYTPSELATLLDLPLTLIEHDAFAGKLKATIIEHNIISITREDALAWLANRS